MLNALPAAPVTKKTKIESIMPPREIRGDTKARRAWLAAKVEEISAQPEREARIVGTGSYQEVSVYRVQTVTTRIQLRGICQGCGGQQALDGERIVRHGYKRPGCGWIYGGCAGQGRVPANVSVEFTKHLIVNVTERAVALEAAQAANAAEYAAADAATPAYETVLRAEWLAARAVVREIEKKGWQLRAEAKAARDFAADLARFVLPAFGTPIAEVAVPA